jgi:hypothetical protein
MYSSLTLSGQKMWLLEKPGFVDPTSPHTKFDSVWPVGTFRGLKVYSNDVTPGNSEGACQCRQIRENNL